jgi:hypothetical protein
MRSWWWRMSAVGGSVRPMSRIDLQPNTAQAGVITAHGAGQATAAFEPAGPIATGALSIIDAAAGVADFTAVTAQGSRASTLLTHAETLGAAATTAVTSLVTIDETNADQLRAVARRSYE